MSFNFVFYTDLRRPNHSLSRLHFRCHRPLCAYIKNTTVSNKTFKLLSRLEQNSSCDYHLISPNTKSIWRSWEPSNWTPVVWMVTTLLTTIGVQEKRRRLQHWANIVTKLTIKERRVHDQCQYWPPLQAFSFDKREAQERSCSSNKRCCWKRGGRHKIVTSWVRWWKKPGTRLGQNCLYYMLQDLAHHNNYVFLLFGYVIPTWFLLWFIFFVFHFLLSFVFCYFVSKITFQVPMVCNKTQHKKHKILIIRQNRKLRKRNYS